MQHLRVKTAASLTRQQSCYGFSLKYQLAETISSFPTRSSISTSAAYLPLETLQMKALASQPMENLAEKQALAFLPLESPGDESTSFLPTENHIEKSIKVSCPWRIL